MNGPALCWCSVIALGRCGDCGRAFCSSHQAAPAGWHEAWTGPARCTDCDARERAAFERDQQARAAGELAVREDRVAAAHRFVAAMTAAGGPGLSHWPTTGLDGPGPQVQGWLLDGHGLAAARSDAFGDHGQYYRNVVLTDGRVGLAWDQAWTYRQQVRGRFAFDSDADARTEKVLGRLFHSDSRWYRRKLREPIVITQFVPFEHLGRDIATSYVHGDSYLRGINADLGAQMAAVAQRHGVPFTP